MYSEYEFTTSEDSEHVMDVRKDIITLMVKKPLLSAEKDIMFRAG